MTPDPGRLAAELHRRFPDARAWHGKHTGTWWAFARDRHGRDRLIEAPDPFQLGRRLEVIGARPAARVPPAARQGIRPGGSPFR